MLSADNGLAEIVMASIGNTWKKLQEQSGVPFDRRHLFCNESVLRCCTGT